MATNQDLPVTDSAAVLHELVGDDATAAFESDPKFVNNETMVDSTSENLQTRSDRQDIQNQPDLNTRAAADDDDDEEEEDDEDDDLDEDDDDDLDEDEDEDLDDEDDEDDEEYEDDDEEDDDEEDEDEE
jgi:hypothetical protein